MRSLSILLGIPYHVDVLRTDVSPLCTVVTAAAKLFSDQVAQFLLLLNELINDIPVINK